MAKKSKNQSNYRVKTQITLMFKGHRDPVRDRLTNNSDLSPIFPPIQIKPIKNQHQKKANSEKRKGKLVKSVIVCAYMVRWRRKAIV